MTEAVIETAEKLNTAIEFQDKFRELKGVQYIEHHRHPNDLHSLRIGMKDRESIPNELNEQMPEWLWGLYIDIPNYDPRWSHYARVGQILFRWNIHHWVRLTRGKSPVMHADKDKYDFSGHTWLYENNEWIEKDM